MYFKEKKEAKQEKEKVPEYVWAIREGLAGPDSPPLVSSPHCTPYIPLAAEISLITDKS